MQPALTPAVQYAGLRGCPICSGAGTLSRSGLIWRFQARPSPLSRTYDLRVVYSIGSAPKVFVDSPDLSVLAEGRALPHVYSPTPPHLCLYMPNTGEWAPHKSVATTIVPWSYVWLFYFEDWLATDNWKGGGAHSVKSQDEEKPASENQKP